MHTQTPGELSPAEACFLPLTPQVKIVCVPGLQAVSQELEGGAATTSLLGMRRGDLPGELGEVVGEVVSPKRCHPHVDTATVLPRGQAPPLKHPCPALPHPVADVLGQS